jgi:uncharacterized protein YdgA (DUF945 family)
MASAAPDAEVLFRLQHDIDHSPVGLDGAGVRFRAAAIETTLLLPNDVSESMLQGFNSEEPVVINTDVKFDGSAMHQLLVSNFETIKDGESIKFDGLDYSAVANEDAIKGSESIGEFTLESPMVSIKLAPGTVDVDLKKFADDVFSGSYGVLFDELSIESTAMPFGINVQEIGFSSNSKINGSTLDSDGNISVGNIESPLPINNFSIAVGTHDLSIEGTSNYVKTMSQFSALNDDNASNPEFLNQWFSALIGVFVPKAGVTYDIDLNNDRGNANIKFNMNVIDGSSPKYPSTGLTALLTVRDLLNVTQAEFSLQADAAALDQTPLAAFLVSPQVEQLVLADGVSYQSTIKVKDFIVDINGNPLSLEMIMGDTLDMPLPAIAGI